MTKTFSDAKRFMELAVEMVSLPHATTNNGPSLDKIPIISFFVNCQRISCR